MTYYNYSPYDHAQHVSNLLEILIARMNERDAQAAAAEEEAAQPAASQNVDEATTTTEQQPEPAASNLDADPIYRQVDRYLHETFTEMLHGLRNPEATWRAWHSAPNNVRSDTGKRLSRDG